MIPDYQTIMKPLLKSLDDDKIKSSQELRENIVKTFNITDDERKIYTPNGKQVLYYNRIAWAISYLRMAQLISSPERGKYQITQIGKNIISNPPEKISTKFLKTLPSFSFGKTNSKAASTDNEEDDDENSNRTPDELIELGYTQINNELSDMLLNHIKNSSPYFFERLVIDILAPISTEHKISLKTD
jgi:restriction system protein